MEKLRGTNDFESLLEFDFKFHYQIILASRNTYLTLLYEGLSSLWQQALKNNLQHSYNHNKSYEFVMGFHHSIIEGLRNRDYHQCTEAQFGAYKRNFTYLKNSMKQ
jgi:DNA-binding FadR family transcriptional regulator